MLKCQNYSRKTKRRHFCLSKTTATYFKNRHQRCIIALRHLTSSNKIGTLMKAFSDDNFTSINNVVTFILATFVNLKSFFPKVIWRFLFRVTNLFVARSGLVNKFIKEFVSEEIRIFFKTMKLPNYF